MAGFDPIAKLPHLCNRQKEDGTFALPEDGRFHIVPLGNYPVSHPEKKGESIIQVVDAEALAKIANRIAAAKQADPNYEILVDYDHFSDDTEKSSAAAGWIDAGLEIRDQGGFAPIRLSNSGRAALTGGDYRFASPVFNFTTAEHLGGKRYRVTELLGVALTNKPNMRGMIPLSNRSQQNSDNPIMKDVLLILGLAATATEPEAVTAITALKNRAAEVDTLRTENATLMNRYDGLLKDQVEADLITLAPHIGDDAHKEHVRAQLLSNREGTLKLFGGLKPAGNAERKPLHNRKEASPAGNPEENAEAETRAVKIRNRAGELQQSERLTFAQAWQRAEGEFAK